MATTTKAQIEKRPWNKNKAVGQMAPFTQEQIDLIRLILTAEIKLRDLALFNTAISTMLRASDLLALRFEDVTDNEGNIKEEINVREKKTRKTNRTHVAVLGEPARMALADWIVAGEKRVGDFLFTSTGNRKTGKHLSRQQYGNLVKQWAAHARIDPENYSTHSMRRTIPANVYNSTHNLAAVQNMLGHKNIGSTAHYLGVDQRASIKIRKQYEM